MFFNKKKEYIVYDNYSNQYITTTSKEVAKNYEHMCRMLNSIYRYYLVRKKNTNTYSIPLDENTRKCYYADAYNKDTVEIVYESKSLSDVINEFNKLWLNDNSIYTILGKYPNLAIHQKDIVAEDKYDYCLKDLNTGNLILVEKQNCFKHYEDAVNALAKKIQGEKSNIEQGLVFDKNTGKVS